MHDPFLKSVFADRRMIEILIRTHVRHWVDEIDFQTLRAEPTEFVSQETLERRHPDMVWSARTHAGATVLLMLEFQRTVDPLMALRTATYATLQLEAIAADPGSGTGGRRRRCWVWRATSRRRRWSRRCLRCAWRWRSTGTRTWSGSWPRGSARCYT